MTDAPDTRDDRTPEGDGPSDPQTPTQIAEPAAGADAAPSQDDAPPAEATPDGPVSEAAAEAPEPQAAEDDSVADGDAPAEPETV